MSRLRIQKYFRWFTTKPSQSYSSDLKWGFIEICTIDRAPVWNAGGCTYVSFLEVYENEKLLRAPHGKWTRKSFFVLANNSLRLSSYKTVYWELYEKVLALHRCNLLSTIITCHKTWPSQFSWWVASASRTSLNLAERLATTWRIKKTNIRSAVLRKLLPVDRSEPKDFLNLSKSVHRDASRHKIIAPETTMKLVFSIFV